MENNKKTREPLDDDALGEVTGGSEDRFQPEEQDMYAEAQDVLVVKMDDEGKVVAPVYRRAYQK